jgi:thiol-disulfide isomerase/thioredoxin
VVLLPIVAIISTATGLYLRSRLQTRGVPRLIVTVLAWGALMGVTAYILVPRAIDAQLTSRPMTPLPPLTLFAQDSVAVAIVPAGGTILVMNFWATWCGPCIREFPELERVYIRFRDNPRVQVYIVNSGWQGDTPEKVAAFLKDRRLPFRSLLDREGTVAKTLEISSIPVTLVVDGHGIVRLRRSGFSAEGRSYADILCDEIDALLQEQ